MRMQVPLSHTCHCLLSGRLIVINANTIWITFGQLLFENRPINQYNKVQALLAVNWTTQTTQSQWIDGLSKMLCHSITKKTAIQTDKDLFHGVCYTTFENQSFIRWKQRPKRFFNLIVRNASKGQTVAWIDHANAKLKLVLNFSNIPSTEHAY